MLQFLLREGSVKPAEITFLGNPNMIFFMKMPTGSIYINYCDDSNFKKVVEKLRSKYEPNFIPKIAEMAGDHRECEQIYDKFSEFRLPHSTHQYMPSDSLIDFINTKKVLHKQPYHRNYESVRASDSSEGGEQIEVTMTRKMQDALLISGSRNNISPCEIIRELVTFYLAIDMSKAFNQDIEPLIVKFNEYLRK
jgi:hypothetical protein